MVQGKRNEKKNNKKNNGWYGALGFKTWISKDGGGHRCSTSIMNIWEGLELALHSAAV